LNAHIVLLPGDGIGPEVISAAVQVLQAVAGKSECRFSFEERLIGGCAIDKGGAALSEDTLAACKTSSAVLLGAVGGPKWDDPQAKVRPEQGLLALRKGLGVYANLRPVRVHPSLVDASPLKPEKLAGVDLLVVRELTGGLYFGQPKGRQLVDGHWRAVDTLEYTDTEIRRVVDLAFRLAQARARPGSKVRSDAERSNAKVTSVDKANVLESSRLWRQVAVEVSAAYPDVKLEHMLVDTASMRLIATPAAFDVLVTENMFGDILTDEASVLAGSMGMLPSASLGDNGPGLYEPIHGSAPDIAGKGIANPIGAILSAAMLLRYSLKLEFEASRIEQAVDRAITDGCRTADLERTEHASLSTQAITDEIIRRI
jgi:3-isopropylmalate dehydrogenase